MLMFCGNGDLCLKEIDWFIVQSYSRSAGTSRDNCRSQARTANADEEESGGQFNNLSTGRVTMRAWSVN